MNEKEIMVGLLREIAKQIQAIDEVSFSELVSGKARLEVVVRRGVRGMRQKSRQRLSDVELAQIGERLRSSNSREEGESLLRDTVTSKDEMARLARKLDLPVQKSDSADQLKARLIESTIGFRLRSAAVQGILKGPTDSRKDKTD